jgi:hypothetical protein
VKSVLRRGSLELRTDGGPEGYTVRVVVGGEEREIGRVRELYEVWRMTGAISSEVYDAAYADGYKAGGNLLRRFVLWLWRVTHKGRGGV